MKKWYKFEELVAKTNIYESKLPIYLGIANEWFEMRMTDDHEDFAKELGDVCWYYIASGLHLKAYEKPEFTDLEELKHLIDIEMVEVLSAVKKTMRGDDFDLDERMKATVNALSMYLNNIITDDFFNQLYDKLATKLNRRLENGTIKGDGDR